MYIFYYIYIYFLSKFSVTRQTFLPHFVFLINFLFIDFRAFLINANLSPNNYTLYEYGKVFEE